MLKKIGLNWYDVSKFSFETYKTFFPKGTVKEFEGYTGNKIPVKSDKSKIDKNKGSK
ncbi:MAG: hypothetical protein GY870_09620 [archaeon]|nr:hypothetical protein [archaeon]